MSSTTPENILSSLEAFLPTIPSINPNRKYWFVRTNGGDYYKDFYFSDIIGIGYNKITANDLTLAKKAGVMGFNSLIKKIEDAYPKHKQPRYVANQLTKFAFDIKAGDIVLVPSQSSWQIAIGEVQSTSVKQKEGEDKAWDDSDEPVGFRKYKSVKWLDVLAREAFRTKAVCIILLPSYHN